MNVRNILTTSSTLFDLMKWPGSRYFVSVHHHRSNLLKTCLLSSSGEELMSYITQHLMNSLTEEPYIFLVSAKTF